MHRHSVIRGLLLPAVAAIGLPLIAAIALPTALSSRDSQEIVIRVTPPCGTREVLLAGSMNGWDGEPMIDGDGDGTFELALLLAPGTYRYRVFADGEPLSGSSAGDGGTEALTVPEGPARDR